MARILPSRIILHGPQSLQKVIVDAYVGETAVGELTADVQWTVEDPAVATIEKGIVRPVADGATTLTATTPLGLATATIEVVHSKGSAEWEFRRHVLPVLARAGCNMGACHGALAGKGGFRLSLRGYNPVGDYETMTQEARGRRIELSDPTRSLILAKPSGALPHKGGFRLDPDGRDYRVLAEWIQDGIAPPTADDPTLVKLETWPADARLTPGQTQQLLITAEYSDGRREDVTGWAKFSSSDQTVAEVDEHGLVRVEGYGQGAIVVWFSSQIVLAPITVPFDYQVPEGVYADAPVASFIDQLVLEKLRQLNLEPSPRCNDSEFIRRIYLDTLGRLPTPEEYDLFIEDSRTDKRRMLVDQLLAHEHYVDYWTYQLSDLLLVNGRRLRPDAVTAYYAWIRSHVAANTPWDQVVREIVTAKGGSIENGATNFFSLHQDPESMSENVSQAFLGLSIGCAKCHNHPLEKWTNDQYYAMANFFSRVKAKGWGGESRSGDGLRTLVVATRGDLIQPLSGVPQVPTPLDGKPLPKDFQGDRREFLADWLVSADNPYFSRAIVNRVWANYLGKGLVEPVDDLRVSNPARHEQLMDALCQYLVRHQFDLRQLTREILNSETYQRSSQPLPNNDADQHFYTRYYPRRLDAEVLLDAISQVTGVPSQFNQIGYDGNDFVQTKAYPTGTRAIELHDSAVVSGFLEKFGRNERDITCECERSNTPSIVQVLHLSNGSTINERLSDENSCVTAALRQTRNWPGIVEDAFVRTLCRRPSEQELQELTSELEQAQNIDKRKLVEDLYWSLMSTREFLFNH